MKRFFVIFVVLFVVAVSGAFAQIPDITAFQNTIQDFAKSVASSLPLESSVGLNWADAYIGQFPHLGIGLTVGAATIPYSAVEKTITAFGGSTSGISSLSSFGVPVPAYTIDARIGGFILPFDIGLKFGYLPPNALSTGNVAADYTMVGADVRYAILKDNLLSPGLSVGIGYTYMRGNVAVKGVLGSSTTISNVDTGSGPTDTLTFTNPDLNFFWNTSVIDAKVQLSKTLLIFTPYVGLGASYGISNAGGGMLSSLLVNGSAPTQNQINYINSHYGTNYSSSNQSFVISEGANGFSTRVFGGFSFNILILKIGVGLEYEFLSGSFAGMANVRLQF